MIELQQEYTADIAAAGKTGYWPSADACRWTATDRDGISANGRGCQNICVRSSL